RRAIGNNRVGQGSLFNGNISFVLNNSELNANSFTVNGLNTPKPYVNQFTPTVVFGGPLMIPHLFRYNGNFTVIYKASRSRSSSTSTGLMPTEAERNGDFSQVLNPLGLPVTVYDPTTGIPFPNNQIPSTRLSKQA